MTGIPGGAGGEAGGEAGDEASWDGTSPPGQRDNNQEGRCTRKMLACMSDANVLLCPRWLVSGGLMMSSLTSDL